MNNTISINVDKEAIKNLTTKIVKSSEKVGSNPDEKTIENFTEELRKIGLQLQTILLKSVREHLFDAHTIFSQEMNLQESKFIVEDYRKNQIASLTMNNDFSVSMTISDNYVNRMN